MNNPQPLPSSPISTATTTHHPSPSPAPLPQASPSPPAPTTSPTPPFNPQADHANAPTYPLPPPLQSTHIDPLPTSFKHIASGEEKKREMKGDKTRIQHTTYKSDPWFASSSSWSPPSVSWSPSIPSSVRSFIDDSLPSVLGHSFTLIAVVLLLSAIYFIIYLPVKMRYPSLSLSAYLNFFFFISFLLVCFLQFLLTFYLKLQRANQRCDSWVLESSWKTQRMEDCQGAGLGSPS